MRKPIKTPPGKNAKPRGESSPPREKAAAPRENAAAAARGKVAAARKKAAALRERLGTLWWYTSVLFMTNRLGDLANIFIGVYLVPKILPSESLGALLPLMAVGGLFATPLALLLIPVKKFLNVFAAREEFGKVRALLMDTFAAALFFCVLMGFSLYKQGDGVLLRLQVTNPNLFWPMAGFALLTCVDPAVNASLHALKLFGPVVRMSLFSPFVRLAAMLMLLRPFGDLGYMVAQLCAALWMTLYGARAVFSFLRDKERRVSYRPELREMWSYSWPLAAFTFAARIQLPIEMLVIRQRLPLGDSAGYYFAMMFGNIPLYIAAAMSPFLWSLISDRYERGEDTRDLFRQSIIFTLVTGLLVVLLFAAIMPWVFSLPGPWREYAAYSHFVWQAALIGTLKNVQNVYTSHEMACRRFRYMRYLVPMMLIESAVLYVLPAWILFKAYLPAGLWNWVALRGAPSLQLFVGIILVANLAFTASMFVEWLLKRHENTDANAEAKTDASAVNV